MVQISQADIEAFHTSFEVTVETMMFMFIQKRVRNPESVDVSVQQTFFIPVTWIGEQIINKKDLNICCFLCVLSKPCFYIQNPDSSFMSAVS